MILRLRNTPRSSHSHRPHPRRFEALQFVVLVLLREPQKKEQETKTEVRSHAQVQEQEPYFRLAQASVLPHSDDPDTDQA
jgi:hypothetical protein